ncbi:MAG: hypothetical protein ACRDYD_00660 [Acidimicrobiales bacterium]
MTSGLGEAPPGECRRSGLGWGAAMSWDRRAYVLVEDDAERSLGPAMAWAAAGGADDLVLLATAAGGWLARRAACFESPPDVLEVEGASLRPAVPEAPPGPKASALGDGDAQLLSEAALEAGAEPVTLDGTLRAEVDGLEVARAERDDAGWYLAVGVGGHDRTAQRLLHGGRPPLSALQAAVSEVRRHRRGGAPSHPANQLAPERWLRATLVRRPEIVGARRLEPVEHPVLSPGLGSRSPCAARGVDGDGSPLLVVCSTGVDLDLVPAAADARSALGAGRLVLAVPEGDVPPSTLSLARRLLEPAQVRLVPRSWR